MDRSFLLGALVLLAVVAYSLGKLRALAVADGDSRKLHSLPQYYGAFTVIGAVIPALGVITVWLGVEPLLLTNWLSEYLPATKSGSASQPQIDWAINEIKQVVLGVREASNENIAKAAIRYAELEAASSRWLSGIALMLGIVCAGLAWRKISVDFRARNLVEGALRIVLVVCSSVAILTTVGIVMSVLFESLRFFQSVPLADFLFGLHWSPQTALRSDQVGSSGAFGAVPLFAGTLLISGIAMVVAAPIGLMAAIYLSEYAGPKFRAFAKPTLEILAGVPTVVYGFFAALTVAPLVRSVGQSMGLEVAAESALAAGLVMGIMIIPFVSSLADDFINAVPQSLRDGSLALGATHAETIRQVILPAALPGIMGGMLLAVSRAIGETMIVVMAAGLTANLTANPLASVTTVTVQIVTLLVGDQEFDSPKTLAAFALGLVLFLTTLVLNVIALYIVRKYREQYE